MTIDTRPPFDPLAVKQRLWVEAGAAPLGILYAVVDGARSPLVYPTLRDSMLPQACLYDGDVAPALLAAAPHIVQLNPHGNYLDQTLFSLGWGQSWGIFVKCELDLDGTRRHLRRFLKVQDDRGRRLLFRYYDPRVLRVYLPTCTADELRTVFGPIDSFFLESATGAELLAHRIQGGALQVSSIGVALESGT